MPLLCIPILPEIHGWSVWAAWILNVWVHLSLLMYILHGGLAWSFSLFSSLLTDWSIGLREFEELFWFEMLEGTNLQSYVHSHTRQLEHFQCVMEVVSSSRLEWSNKILQILLWEWAFLLSCRVGDRNVAKSLTWWRCPWAVRAV
jgi:hypothetical protein